jgi:hypothetical protein
MVILCDRSLTASVSPKQRGGIRSVAIHETLANPSGSTAIFFQRGWTGAVEQGPSQSQAKGLRRYLNL